MVSETGGAAPPPPSPYRARHAQPALLTSRPAPPAAGLPSFEMPSHLQAMMPIQQRIMALDTIIMPHKRPPLRLLVASMQQQAPRQLPHPRRPRRRRLLCRRFRSSWPPALSPARRS